MTMGILMFSTINVSAMTIDLMYLFDLDNDGSIILGDGYPGGSDMNTDSLGQAFVSHNFNLTHQPISSGVFKISFAATNVQLNNILTFNNSNFSISNGDNLFQGSNSILLENNNTMSFSIAHLSSDNLDDIIVTGLEISYEDSGPYSSPVPEPATLMLLGSGLFGLAGFRKKMKK